jgi:hypothetical protein
MRTNPFAERCGPIEQLESLNCQPRMLSTLISCGFVDSLNIKMFICTEMGWVYALPSGFPVPSKYLCSFTLFYFLPPPPPSLSPSLPPPSLLARGSRRLGRICYWVALRFPPARKSAPRCGSALTTPSLKYSDTKPLSQVCYMHIVYIGLSYVLLVLNYYIQTIPGKLHSIVVYLSVYMYLPHTCILCSYITILFVALCMLQRHLR